MDIIDTAATISLLGLAGLFYVTCVGMMWDEKCVPVTLKILVMAFVTPIFLAICKSGIHLIFAH